MAACARILTTYLIFILHVMNDTYFDRKITDTCRVAKAVKVTLQHVFITRRCTCLLTFTQCALSTRNQINSQTLLLVFHFCITTTFVIFSVSMLTHKLKILHFFCKFYIFGAPKVNIAFQHHTLPSFL